VLRKQLKVEALIMKERLMELHHLLVVKQVLKILLKRAEEARQQLMELIKVILLKQQLKKEP
jgi:hypothetical protein